MKRRATLTKCRLLASLFLCLICACSDNEDWTVERDVRDVPSLTVIFSTNGLGDMTYNDGLLAEVMRFALQHEDSLALHLVTPKTHEQGIEAFRQWTETDKNTSGNRRLLVLASSEYQDMLSGTILNLAENNNILLFETRHTDWPEYVSSFDLCLYGVSYMAGYAAAKRGSQKAAIIAAMPNDTKIIEGANGFADGMKAADATDAAVERFYLSDSAEGYALPDSAFVLVSQIRKEKTYDCIYPLCGGSALGIYRFLYSDIAPTVIGMDRDCGELCYFLPFSVVRDVGKILADRLDDWYRGKELPRHTSFGLESGYTYMKKKPNHHQSTDWEALGEEVMKEAIRKEQEYEDRQNK